MDRANKVEDRYQAAVGVLPGLHPVLIIQHPQEPDGFFSRLGVLSQKARDIGPPIVSFIRQDINWLVGEARFKGLGNNFDLALTENFRVPQVGGYFLETPLVVGRSPAELMIGDAGKLTEEFARGLADSL